MTHQQPTNLFMQTGSMQAQPVSNMNPQMGMPLMQGTQGMQGMPTNVAGVNTGMGNMNLGTGMGNPMQMGAAPASQMGMPMNNMGMMGTSGMAGNPSMNSGMQYNYQTMGMKMPMQAGIYPMQGTAGKFRS